MLVWKDGERTRAVVPRLAPEVTCGKARFQQDADKPHLFREV